MTYGEKQLDEKLRNIIRSARQDTSILDAIEQIHEAYQDYIKNKWKYQEYGGSDMWPVNERPKKEPKSANGRGLGWL